MEQLPKQDEQPDPKDEPRNSIKSEIPNLVHRVRAAKEAFYKEIDPDIDIVWAGDAPDYEDEDGGKYWAWFGLLIYVPWLYVFVQILSSRKEGLMALLVLGFRFTMCITFKMRVKLDRAEKGELLGRQNLRRRSCGVVDVGNAVSDSEQW